MFILFVWIFSDKLNNNSRHLLVPFRRRHWALFCKTAVRQNITKIITIFFIKLELIFGTVYLTRRFKNLLKIKSFTGIFLGLRLKAPFCNFREQLFFLFNCEWLLPIIYFTSPIKKIQAGEKSNNNTSNSRGKIKATRLVKLLFCFSRIVGVCCTWRAPTPNVL